MRCFCNYIYKLLDILVVSDKDEKKNVGPVSCILFVTWLAGKLLKNPHTFRKQ